MMTASAAAQILQATLASLPVEVIQALGTTNMEVEDPGPYTGTEPTDRAAAATAPKNPYPASPSTAGLGTCSGTMASGTHVSPGQRPRGGARQPVKGAPLHPVHAVEHPAHLTQKLEAARQALYPFGLPPPGLHARTERGSSLGERGGSHVSGEEEDGKPPEGGKPLENQHLDGLK